MEESMLQLHPGDYRICNCNNRNACNRPWRCQQNKHVISTKKAAIWTIIWISMAMLFSGVVYLVYNNDGHEIAVEKFTQFQAAYWIEKALSVDNLFVLF